MDDIYSELKKRYKKLGFFSYLYFIIRWQLVNFNKIEKLISKSGNILDFGCGIGILSNLLALTSKERKVVGIDNNRKAIMKGEKVGKDIENINFINSINKTEKKFKDIILIDVLHHIPYKKQKEILINLKERLDINGKLIIQDIDKNSFPKYLIGYLIDVIRCGRKNIFYRSKNQFISLLKELGFKVRILSNNRIAHITFIVYE